MIGFTMHAYGLGRFVADARRSTEGRIWFGGLAALGSIEPLSPGVRKAALRAVEHGFKRQAQLEAYNACAQQWDCLLTVVGDVRLSFRFESGPDPRAQYTQFSRILDQVKLGDQVVLTLVRLLAHYQWHVLEDGYTGPCWLQLSVEL
ncbi:MAG: hypothetical protein IPL40_12910 [Proteobacteria bacterium]|nr:hypothetical protein [Pseudomonadota bacterium]